MFCRGSAFRHKVFGLNPHIAGATIVTGVVLWFTSALRSRFSDIPLLRLAALWLRVSIGVQLLLGAAVLWSRLYSRQSQQPIPVMVTLTVAYTLFGVLLPASC